MLAPDRIDLRAPAGGPSRLRFPPDALVVVGGVPGAGKTTLLRRLFAGGPAEVLDSEDVAAALQARLHTARGYRALRPLVHTLHWLRIGRALRGDRPVVVHETATRPHSRRALAAWARLHGRPAHLVLLDVDAATARAGQRARGRSVREASLARHVARFGVLRDALGDGPPDGYAGAVTLSRSDAQSLRSVRFVAPVACAGR